ncbi:MAG: hypothetical protein MUO72_19555 [Bacteroidales bacterium]|nr:hypothetical protein [Bacteroidales bacterium]
MKQIKTILYVLLLYSFCPQIVRSGKTIPATGGTAIGSGGTATYTSGKLVFKVITGKTISVIQGVQQPYEISVVTVIEKPEDITMECKAYPNPNAGSIRLVMVSLRPGDRGHLMVIYGK